MREWRKKKENWEKEGEKDWIRKAKKEQMSDEELDQLRLRNKLNKQKSRSNISHQKKCAPKVKERKCKSEVNDKVKESPKDYSTPRVQKYQQRKKESQLKVKVLFLRKSPKRLTSSERANVSRAIKFINTLESPRTKAKIIS